jgi:hypothetical protein
MEGSIRSVEPTLRAESQRSWRRVLHPPVEGDSTEQRSDRPIRSLLWVTALGHSRKEERCRGRHRRLGAHRALPGGRSVFRLISRCDVLAFSNVGRQRAGRRVRRGPEAAAASRRVLSCRALREQQFRELRTPSMSIVLPHGCRYGDAQLTVPLEAPFDGRTCGRRPFIGWPSRRQELLRTLPREPYGFTDCSPGDVEFARQLDQTPSFALRLVESGGDPSQLRKARSLLRGELVPRLIPPPWPILLYTHRVQFYLTPPPGTSHAAYLARRFDV